jgi:DNA-binding MarR family transcriptional regulator
VKARAPAPGARYRALLQLLRTADSLWNASRVFFSRWNLSPSQFNVLNLLADQPEGLSQSELGRLLIMHRSNVTGLVDRLEQRGLLRRRDAAGDRRAYCVVLTAAGRKRVGQITPEYLRLADKVWGNFPVSRAGQLTSDLEQISAGAARLLKSKGAI